MTQMLTNVRGKVKTGHANLSFFFALIGGGCAAFSPIGDIPRALFGLFFWGTPLIVFAVLASICSGDWSRDSVPNRPAVYTAMLWPIALVQSLTDSHCATKVFWAVRTLSKHTGGWGQQWQAKTHDFLTVGADTETACTVFGLAFIAMGIVYSQRYANSSKKSAGVGGSR